MNDKDPTTVDLDFLGTNESFDQLYLFYANNRYIRVPLCEIMSGNWVKNFVIVFPEGEGKESQVVYSSRQEFVAMLNKLCASDFALVEKIRQAFVHKQGTEPERDLLEALSRSNE